MNDFDKQLLEELCATVSPSSREYDFQTLLQRKLLAWGYTACIDANSNLFTIPDHAGKDTLLIMAHSDQVALQVKEITEGGFIKFRKIGGIDIHSFYGQEVIVVGKEQSIAGVIGRDPRNVNESESGFTINTKSLWVDTGATSAEDLENLIEINDFILFKSKPTYLLNNRVSMAAADDKLGVYCIMKLAEQFRNVRNELPFNLCFALSSQEEIGCRGSKALALRFKPKYAITVDTEYASDFPGGSGSIELGNGPVLTDNADNNPKMVKMARKSDISHQYAFTSEFCGCTDAESFITHSPDTAILGIGIPVRNMHSANEVFDSKDLINTVRIISDFINRIKDEAV